jgi:ATP-dependent DNA helicase RecG
VDLQYIKGIGPQRAEALEASGIHSLEDLLQYYPRKYLDASAVVQLRDILQHLRENVTVRGKVLRKQLFDGKKPHRLVITLQDESGGTLDLVYFKFADYIAKQYAVGEELIVVGYVATFNNRSQMVHPLHVERLAGLDELASGKLLSIYPLNAGFKSARIQQRQLRDIIHTALGKAENEKLLCETLPEQILHRRTLLQHAEAVREIHEPTARVLLDHAILRLKYEELFFLQLRLGFERKRNALNMKPGIAFEVRALETIDSFRKDSTPEKGNLVNTLLHSLPYSLTGAQLHVVKEIAHDMSKHAGKKPMHRLLQGDVGTGKTVVATLTMLAAIENGYQCAFMAPTEILAEQHFNTLSQQLAGLPVELTLLVGAQRKRVRAEALNAIQTGTAHIAIGTHALLEEGVIFDRLGLVVIDEQHRFGVAQRKRLIDKASSPTASSSETGSDGREHIPTHSPDVLIMTATPIPRTLGMTLYGDLDVSIIREYPKDRKAIKTQLLFQRDHDKIYKAIRRAVQERGEQVYIVYPLVEESERSDLAAAKKAFEELSLDIFPDLKIGLLHGKMPPKEKLEAMIAFRDNVTQVLVATTVIEVGVDVPNAAVMIIEHADRFGLAQLHQLRGRVGRGSTQSHCILVASDKLLKPDNLFQTSSQIEEQTVAEKRLAMMVETTDGFRIAEADLEIRGPGEFFGTKQSGVPELQLANLVTDVGLMETAREDAIELIEQDPHLRAPENEHTRTAFLAQYHKTESYLQIG